MVTDEALAERQAALEGDPGTDSAVKVNIPQEPFSPKAEPAHSAPAQSAHGPHESLESRVCKAAFVL